jgi:hypothetical protein
MAYFTIFGTKKHANEYNSNYVGKSKTLGIAGEGNLRLNSNGSGRFFLLP